MEIPKDTKIGTYEIKDKIGSGGMGCVYLAYQPNLDRQVAIKSINLGLSDDPDFKQRAIKEAKNQCKLKDDRIVQVYDAFEDPTYGNLIVMEYVRGQGLDKIISTRTCIPEPEAIEIFKEILKAMHYAHGKNIIHRDLKPAML